MVSRHGWGLTIQNFALIPCQMARKLVWKQELRWLNVIDRFWGHVRAAFTSSRGLLRIEAQNSCSPVDVLAQRKWFMECHSEDGARLAELGNMTRCGTKDCVALLGLHVHIVGRLHPVLFYERSFPVAVSTSAPLSNGGSRVSTLAVWRRLLGVSCFNYFEQLLCLVPQNPHLNMFFALFRSDWILPPPSDPSWWERRPWERRPRDEVAPPPPNRDRSRSPLREPMTPPGPPPPTPPTCFILVTESQWPRRNCWNLRRARPKASRWKLVKACYCSILQTLIALYSIVVDVVVVCFPKTEATVSNSFANHAGWATMETTTISWRWN